MDLPSDIFDLLDDSLSIMNPPGITDELKQDWLEENYRSCINDAFEFSDLNEINEAALHEKALNRLRGRIRAISKFSPYDLACAYMEQEGLFAQGDDTSRASIAKQKALIHTSSPDMKYLMRKINNKGSAEKLFCRTLSGLGLTRDIETLTKISEFNIRGNRIEGMPWLDPRPDGLLEDSDGNRHLVHYVCTADASRLDTLSMTTPDEYALRLHANRLALGHLGVKVDEMHVVMYDIANHNVAYADVEPNLEIEQSLADAGFEMSQHIHMGAEPKRPPSDQDYSKVPALPEDAHDLMCRFILADVLEKLVAKDAKKAKTALEEVLKKYGMYPESPNSKVNIPFVNIGCSKGRETVDKPALLQAYIENVGNLDDLQATDDKGNVQFDYLRSHLVERFGKEIEESFVKQGKNSVRFTIDKKTHKDVYDALVVAADNFKAAYTADALIELEAIPFIAEGFKDLSVDKDLLAGLADQSVQMDKTEDELGF
ncbi:hypothetical protein [Neptuniibacter sp. QD37_11]|uniref:hypothetical protein n=1 Tax=Neptuniibacter sp. QD37_11 TaxID=3398209 RepID=UPI0039F47AD3